MPAAHATVQPCNAPTVKKTRSFWLSSPARGVSCDRDRSWAECMAARDPAKGARALSAPPAMHPHTSCGATSPHGARSPCPCVRPCRACGSDRGLPARPRFSPPVPLRRRRSASVAPRRTGSREGKAKAAQEGNPRVPSGRPLGSRPRSPAVHVVWV
jgi:hypothetical protein